MNFEVRRSIERVQISTRSCPIVGIPFGCVNQAEKGDPAGRSQVNYVIIVYNTPPLKGKTVFSLPVLNLFPQHFVTALTLIYLPLKSREIRTSYRSAS